MPYRFRHERRVTAAGVLCCAVVWSSLTLAQAPPSPDYSQEAVVIQQSRTIYRFEKDGTGRREVYMRLKAQSEAGVQQWGQIVVGYNAANERPEVRYVRVHKPDGSIVTTPHDAVQDLTSPVQRVAPIYTDFRQKHVTVEALRPGDTLEFAVITTIHTALAPSQFWTEYDFQREAIVLDEQLEVDVPADHLITLKTQPGFDAAVNDSDGRRTYRWARAQLTRTAERAEKEKREANDGKAAQEARVAAIRLTTFQTWEQVGRWYAALEGPQRTPGADVRRKAQELVAGLTTDLAKIEALYEFVATNFRYVSLSLGLGRYQPRAAGEVLREQYGDCKDKHTLLASLMDAVGLNASAVLINSEAKIDPSFPSPSQFDHVITRAMVAGDEVWVDTTSEVAPFRLLAQPLRNKQALVVDTASAPRLIDTPANPPTKSFVAQDIDATLGDTGTLDAHVRMSFRGDVELLMRTIFRGVPASDWKKLLEQVAGSLGATGEVSNWKVGEPAALRAPYTIEFDLSVPRYADLTSNKLTVSLPLAKVSMTNSADDDAQDEPTIPLGAAPSEASYRLRLRLPATVTIQSPVPVTVARDYAEYRSVYSITGSTFSAERLATVRRSELPSDRRQDYAAFVRVVSADARQTLALHNTAPIASNASATSKVSELNRSGYDALQAGNYAQAVALLTRVVELEPKDKVAWNNLGQAYMGLRKTEPAIEAYRKQIEINPYDASAYNNLGRAYMAQQKYAEAEAAFQKQLEVNPLDRYAPANLGWLYVERRQYEQAIPPLEKAIALSPDYAWLHVQRGKALLHLKRDVEAIAAFDRAVELSPTPTMWNDIGYELAVKGVHLDRAQQYAESAVSSVTAASRNLDIARADDKALAVVRSLAAYWDTLGWVYFARGDLGRAERFVEASWQLGQHGEVGDHLAQIYEKQGRRDDAVRTYAMALAAYQPPPDLRERLANLLGSMAQVDAVVSTHRDQLSKARTIPIAGKGIPGKTTDVFVLIAAPSTIEGVRFVSSDDAFRSFDAAIRAAAHGRMFPEDGPAKILRRGIVACEPSGGGCTLTLLLPDDAEPVK
jgi:tetratricopeptide (TPR) repeat protein/transglutaminase-like putative cysteine protease